MKEMRDNMKYVMQFIKEEDGIGIVELILILVILIALVLLFKNKITSVIDDAWKSFDKDSKSIINGKEG